jgi:hypothetical protein
MQQAPSVYFTEHFRVTAEALEAHGAFNISLVTDLPLFIDPFLLFNSKEQRYRELHDEIIRYLKFLRDKARVASLSPGLLAAWYRFPEIKQTWLGFSESGNSGRGLGPQFASALQRNLDHVFHDFGAEQISHGSHLEKLCLIRGGVGRDNISDFTTNLIGGFLAEYTQTFARNHIGTALCRDVAMRKARFNYETESWEAATYTLPWHDGDFVLLTPKDVLTKDDTWINKTDLINDFEDIPDSIPNEELRAQINNYFRKMLPTDREPTRKDSAAAVFATLQEHPELVDWYIRYKEDHGDTATSVSAEKVSLSERLYVRQLEAFRSELARETRFYAIPGDTHAEAHERVAYLKDVIENKGGHRIFYVAGKQVQREEDVHVLFRMVWFNTTSDVSTEVNDGRGPADVKVSRGAGDKTIVEFKLAKNTHLRQNLEKQAEAYQRASDAASAIKVIVYFSDEELVRVRKILKDLDLTTHKDVVLIDAGRENKVSGSRAR